MIAAYQRISRADGDLGKDRKDKSNSIKNQKELIQRYISHKESLQNLPVMDFVDDGYTGSNFDRPGFQKMMDGVRSGEIDTIIVKDLSRFGRDYIGVGEYMEQIFPLLGVRLISINDNYDSSNYNGTTLGMDLVVSNLVNTMYCRDAGKKLRTANRVKWRKGISTASAAPFGYQFDPNRKGSYIIDPPAAKIVRRIFDLAILGLGTREIAMALNDENAPVPSVYNREHKAYGKETTYTIAPVILWDSSRVWKILTAYVYTGAMVLGKSQRLISGKKIIRIVPKGQQYITEGTHEAIVSREEFEKVQLVIRNNGHRVVMGSVDFPLKGKIRCGNCRRVLRYDYKQASPIFWCREGMELIGQTQCSSEIYQASDIENAVFQALKKELSLLDSLYSDIKKEEQSLKEASRKASRRKTLMEQELKNLKGEKMRMYEEYASGTLSLDNYKSKKLECDRKIAEVQDKIEQFKAEESVKSVVPGTVRAAAEQAEADAKTAEETVEKGFKLLRSALDKKDRASKLSLKDAMETAIEDEDFVYLNASVVNIKDTAEKLVEAKKIAAEKVDLYNTAMEVYTTAKTEREKTSIELAYAQATYDKFVAQKEAEAKKEAEKKAAANEQVVKTATATTGKDEI